MTRHPTIPGLNSVDVLLPTYGGLFQIIHNNDFGLAFYPAAERGDASSGGEVLGPDEFCDNMWELLGKPGDVFRIEFHRTVELGTEMKKVSWNMVRQQSPDQELVRFAGVRKYYISWSWNPLSPSKMLWNG